MTIAHREHDVTRAETLLGLLRAFRDDHKTGSPIHAALALACMSFGDAVNVIHKEHDYPSMQARLTPPDKAA